MCAGQIYLLQLISSARTGTGQSFILLAYCTAFLLPSILVSIIVFQMRSHLQTASFLANHMAEVKVLTSIAMAVLILLAWII